MNLNILTDSPLKGFAIKTVIAICLLSGPVYWIAIKVVQEMSPYHQCTKHWIEKEGKLRDEIHLYCIGQS
jgi:hypothetical protein